MKTTANILVNHVKQRMYFNNTVFLNNNSEFEIEFFNKSSKTVCPSITINGEKLTSSPVIYNGQKYTLTDFITIHRKFLFTVYKIDNSEEALKATIDNGIVDIKYYYEKDLSQYKPIEKKEIIDESNSQYDIKMSTVDVISETPSLEEIETGKITKGSNSDVEYEDVDIELDYNTFEHQIIYLLPLSKKPLNKKCSNCGNVSSIEDNYCSKCSHDYFNEPIEDCNKSNNKTDIKI